MKHDFENKGYLESTSTIKGLLYCTHATKKPKSIAFSENSMHCP